MSSFENNGITAKGNNLLAKVAAGLTKLNYTKAVVGDGTLGQGQAIISLTNLISPKNTWNINRLVATPGDPAWATVGFVYSNQSVTSSYYLREIGIFATDPDEGEILYWYGNAGATADFIKPGDGSGSDIIEKKFDIGIYVGQSANVTATIDGSLVFPTYEEFDAAIAAARQYTDTKFASIVIEAASTTKAGVTKLNNATNSTSQTEASTPLATKTAMDKANKAEADAATAQARAVSAETNAKNDSLPRTGGTISGPLRVNGELTFSDGSTATQLKQSVSDGKAKLKGTIITEKGGTVSQAGSVPTFDELDAGVRSIQQGRYLRQVVTRNVGSDEVTPIAPNQSGVIGPVIASFPAGTKVITSSAQSYSTANGETIWSAGTNSNNALWVQIGLVDSSGLIWNLLRQGSGNAVLNYNRSYILSLAIDLVAGISHTTIATGLNDSIDRIPSFHSPIPVGFNPNGVVSLRYFVSEPLNNVNLSLTTRHLRIPFISM